MKGVAKWVLCLFGIYSSVIGLVAVIEPNYLTTLYAVTEFSDTASMTARWLGALSIGMAYGAFSMVRKPNREIARILMIGAVATMAGSMIGLLSGEATINGVGFDFVIQAAMVAALMTTGKEYGKSM